jgi:hypothetical protein
MIFIYFIVVFLQVNLIGMNPDLRKSSYRKSYNESNSEPSSLKSISLVKKKKSCDHLIKTYYSQTNIELCLFEHYCCIEEGKPKSVVYLEREYKFEKFFDCFKKISDIPLYTLRDDVYQFALKTNKDCFAGEKFISLIYIRANELGKYKEEIYTEIVNDSFKKFFAEEYTRAFDYIPFYLDKLFEKNAENNNAKGKV